MRTAFATLAAFILCTAAPGLEQSLILNSGYYKAQINPQIGTVTIFAVEGQQLTYYNSINFLSDLSFLESWIIRAEGNFNALRTGSMNNTPSTEELLSKLPAKPTAREATAGVPPLQERARNAEKKWWVEEAEAHKYDGVVQGAISQDTIMLAIPSKRVLLLYQFIATDIELKAWRCWGGELYVPQVLNSSPTPEELLNQLPSEIQAERRKAIDEGIKALAEGSDKSIPTKPSEIWIGGAAQNRYFLLDHANRHVMTYEWTGKNLKLMSVRNLEIDLMIPSGFRSFPAPHQMLDALEKDRIRGQWLRQRGYSPMDMDMLSSIAGSRKAASGGKLGPIQATMPQNTDDAVVDFTEQNKLMVFRVMGANNGLELVSLRDYTLDAAISVLDTERREEQHAMVLLDQANKHAQARNYQAAIAVFATALKLDPCLFAKAEQNGSIKSALSKDAALKEQWTKMIEESQKACEEKQKAIKARIDGAAERKKKREEARQGGK